MSIGFELWAMHCSKTLHSTSHEHYELTITKPVYQRINSGMRFKPLAQGHSDTEEPKLKATKHHTFPMISAESLGITLFKA